MRIGELDGSNSAETVKEAQKVTVKENSRPTDLLAAANQDRADQCSHEVKVGQRNNSVKELEPSSNQIPVQPGELRWWVKVGIGGFRIRPLYDTGASRTVMGSLDLQLATECGRKFQPASGVGARGAGNNLLKVTGYVELPFELGGIKKDILVSIIPELEVDCYVGSNFVRAFETVHDPVENRLIVRQSGKSIGLELACVFSTEPNDHTQIRIASIDTTKAS